MNKILKIENTLYNNNLFELYTIWKELNNEKISILNAI